MPINAAGGFRGAVMSGYTATMLNAAAVGDNAMWQNSIITTAAGSIAAMIGWMMVSG